MAKYPLPIVKHAESVYSPDHKDFALIVSCDDGSEWIFEPMKRTWKKERLSYAELTDSLHNHINAIKGSETKDPHEHFTSACPHKAS